MVPFGFNSYTEEEVVASSQQGEEGAGGREDEGCVRPGAAGLLIGIECSRVRDSSWIYLISLVTTRIGVELAAVQRKLPDRTMV